MRRGSEVCAVNPDSPHSPGRPPDPVTPVPTVVLQPSTGLRSALEAPADPVVAVTTTDQAQRYTVLGELGRGGMGVALRVFDTVLRRELAMKVLANEALAVADREEITRRFVDEARVTGCLQHPGIVPVHDLHADASGRIFFTMPIIAGIDFHEVIRRVAAGDPEWPLLRAVGVLLKVCDAVAFAHSRGVLHRDLTPANVRIGTFGEVHVIDWGLAKVLGRDPPAAPRPPSPPPRGLRRWRRHRDHDVPPATMYGTVLGTPSYMPPEQAEGRLDEMSPRSDVYAIGALLYHLLTGVAPFTSQKRTLPPERILRLVRRGKPPAIDRLNRAAPPELVAIAQKAMQRDLANRHPDMPTMAADLQAWVDGRVVPTYESGMWATLRKLVHRNRLTATIVAAAVVAILFNLVEFGISHFRYQALLRSHDEQLRTARDQRDFASERARKAHDAIAAILASLPADDPRRAALVELLADAERASQRDR